ncbi:MAG TPA: hypothetical protein VMQ86_21520 [Bryobacteraceae bacterium]|jgi:hypothetical protein|nr:hypothetical protein [Bryobacteraceae bacterium]
MKLSDLRKVTVKKHLRIRFSLSNGMECVVNEHGIAQVPALRAVPAFNLEEELVGAQVFVVEPADARDTDRDKNRDKNKDKGRLQPRSYTRDQMTAFAAADAGPAIAHEEHED